MSVEYLKLRHKMAQTSMKKIKYNLDQKTKVMVSSIGSLIGKFDKLCCLELNRLC